MTQTLATRFTSSTDERRHITVMFCDLVGSTEILGQVDAEDARDIFRQYQALCQQVVSAHDGFVAQYLGDGVLAYFGYPHNSEDDAERAVSCALELVRKVAQIPAAEGQLAARAGLASGLTVVGSGMDDAVDRVSVTGQAINLASRIQTCVNPGAVGLADTTYRLVRGKFDCVCSGFRDLKGIARPVQLWVARSPRSIPRRWHAAGAPGLLLGREAELDRLAKLWEEARKGNPQAAVIWGEAGIGKTRLIRSLRRVARGATTLELQCSAMHGLTPLYPVISAIGRAVGQISADSPGFIETVAAFLGGTVDDDSLMLATLLFPRASGALDIAALPAAQRREMLIQRLVEHILQMARSHPRLILLEDAHWSDPTTLELVARLRTAASDAPLLLLLSFRSDSRPDLAGEPGVESIQLNALDDRVQKSIVERMSEGRIACDALAAIIARSDGNPLHAIEITLSALEQQSDSASLHHVPDSLFDGFAARLDRLGDAKPVAQNAAAIGRRFNVRLLGSILGTSRSSLAPALSQLVGAGVVRQVVGSNEEYEFRHSLLQDVAYETLLKRARLAIHERIAGELEVSGAATIAPEVIAYHWIAADRPERALPSLNAAARYALDHGMYVEAMGHLDQARGLFQRVGEVLSQELEFDLQLSLGRASYVLNGPAHDLTVTAYSRAQELMESIPDAERQAILLYGIFSGYHFASRFDLAQEPANRMLELAEAAGSRAWKCLAHRMLGYLDFFRGSMAEARTHFGDVRSLYDFKEDVPTAPKFGADHLSATEGFDSVLDALGGDPDTAVLHARKTLEHARSVDHPPSIGWAYAASAYVDYFRRDSGAARRIASEGARFCQEHRIAAWYAHCRLFEIWASPDRKAEDVQAIISLAGAGNRLGLPLFRGVLAEVLWSSGAKNAALDEINRALAEVAQFGQFVFETHLRLLRAAILRDTGSASNQNVADAVADAESAARRYGSGLVQQDAWSSLR